MREVEVDERSEVAQEGPEVDENLPEAPRKTSTREPRPDFSSWPVGLASLLKIILPRDFLRSETDKEDLNLSLPTVIVLVVGPVGPRRL